MLSVVNTLLLTLSRNVGPIVYGPISEVYGRTIPLWTGMVAFCIFQIPVAVARNLQTIFVCRCMQAIFGAAPVGVLGGLYVDILEPIEIGVALSVFAGVVFASPAAGPIVGSYLTQSSLGWRWTAWITLIIGALVTKYLTKPVRMLFREPIVSSSMK